MPLFATQTELSHEQPCLSFIDSGHPTLKTTPAVMKALRIALTTMLPAAA